MEKIISSSFRLLINRSIIFVTVLAVIFSSLGSSAFLPLARATVTPTVTSLITSATTAKASSTPRAALKVIIAVDGGETLTSLRITATDSASTSFAPATDLTALATDATSGIAIYNDAGGTVGSFDATDAVVTLSGASAFSSGSTTLTLASAGAAGTYYIVYRTASAAGGGPSFFLNLPATRTDMSRSDPTLGVAVVR